MTGPGGHRSLAALRAPIVPERVRAIGRDGFAFIPNRFMKDGFFAVLTPDERALYFLLLLAGNRQGVSFYHYDTICALLELPLEIYLEARNALIQKDLIAFDGTRFQILELPQHAVAAPKALRTPEELETNDAASIRASISRALRRDARDDD